MYANKKDTVQKEIDKKIVQMGYLVKDCSSNKDGSQDVDWYSAYDNEVIHIEYKSKIGKLTEQQKRFRAKNPFYKIEICRSFEDALDILISYKWLHI